MLLAQRFTLVKEIYLCCSLSQLHSEKANCTFFLADESEEKASLGQQQQEEECMWVWLLDLERSVALAVGRCLGGMLQGPLPSLQEKMSEFWLSNILLRNGLEMDFDQLGRKTHCLFFSGFRCANVFQIDTNKMQCPNCRLMLHQFIHNISSH